MSSPPVYSPPGADLGSAHTVRTRPLPLALLVGLLADWVPGMIVMVIFAGIYMGVRAASQGGMVDPDALAKDLNSDPGYLLIGLLLSLPFSALGGYVAARVRNLEALRTGAYYGALSCVLGLLLALSSIDASPIAITFAGLLITPLAAVSGGYLRQRQLDRMHARERGFPSIG